MKWPQRVAEADAWSDVTIGIVAAISVEGAAMRALVSSLREIRVDLDPNEYRVGYLSSTEAGRPHRVVLVTLAEDNTRNAAATCTDMLRSFPRIRCVIMAGIAGGVPAPNRPLRHVRLGDVVLAVDGVVDYGHIRQGERAEPRRPISGISMELKRAAQHLQQGQYLGETISWQQLLAPADDVPMAVFARPPDETDHLHDGHLLIPHPDRRDSHHPIDNPKVHFGSIGCADVLLKNAAIRDEQAARLGVIAFEMEAAGVATAVANRGLNWFVVRGIVDYCDEYKNDVWHAYAALAAAGGVRAVLALCPPFPVWRIASAGVRTLLPEWDMDRLQALLAQCRDVDGLTAWQAAVSGGLIPPPGRPASLIELSAMLADLNAGPDRIPPLVAFAENVASRAPHHLAGELRAWIDQMARQHLHLADEIAAYRRHIGRAQAMENRSAERRVPIRPCLVIQIERDGIDSESCEVRYWIQRHSRAWQPEPSGPTATTFRQLERVLEAAIQQAETAWRDVGDDRKPLEIEFLLPGDLLHTAVEWWRIELDAPAPSPLCLDYLVVVRSLDRMRHGHRHRVWNHRWNALWQHPQQHRIYWGRATPEAEDLGPWNARLRDDQDLTTVILGSTPEHEAGGQELQTALNAGIPVILWDHRPGSLTPEMAGMLGRLTEATPGELVDRVRHLRREAGLLPDDEQAHHPGRNVALLWDDPHRNVYDAGAQT